MRVAEVSPPWLAVPPRGYGGLEWVVALLTDGLVDHGHDVTLFATGDSATKANLEYVFPEAPGPEFVNSIQHDVLQTLLAYRDPDRFDVFHIHNPWAELVAATMTDHPTVHTLHFAFEHELRREIYTEVSDRLWYVALSEAQRKQMPELRYAGVVYNGIDLDAYPFREEKDDFLLFLGRAAPDKGPLRAIETAREAGMRIILAVKVANAEERKHWAEDIQPILGGDTEVLGELTGTEKADLLARAKAVLFPISWEEPFGLVMTEAMASGTPVIATPRGSVPEVIADGETGFIVSVDDYAAEAAEALQRVKQLDPRAGRDRVERLFSKEAMVRGYEAVFERALSG